MCAPSPSGQGWRKGGGMKDKIYHNSSLGIWLSQNFPAILIFIQKNPGELTFGRNFGSVPEVL
jgi:hypothetical protein